MNIDWTLIVQQLPFVVVIVWYSLARDKTAQEAQNRFMAALDKRDEEFERRNTAVVNALNELTRCLAAHDEKVQERIATSQDKVIDAVAVQRAQTGRGGNR